MHLFVGLLVAVVALALLATPLKLPRAVILVFGGIAVAALPFAPHVRLDPDLILLVFLPPILDPAAHDFASEDLRANARPIMWLAVGLVFATIATIAVAVHFVLGVAWGPAFVLGAILGATDPVTATATATATAILSLTRLSPLRMVAMRPGAPDAAPPPA